MAKPLMTIDPTDAWEWVYQPTADEPARRNFVLSRTNRKPRELGWLMEVEMHADLPDIRAKLDAVAVALTGKAAAMRNLDDPN